MKYKLWTYLAMVTTLCALVAAVGVAPAMAGETALYSFNPYFAGSGPGGTLYLAPDGNLYGMTNSGGGYGAGVVFEWDKKGRETVLYTFTGGADGGFPYFQGVIMDSAGNLYGAVDGGGTNGVGVVFKLDRKHNESVLYSFTGGNDGAYPSAVIMDDAGNLYGTACCGGAFGAGVVFELSPNGVGGYNETTLYTFTGGADGDYPNIGVIRDYLGNLYGTTTYGGASGAGVVYKIDKNGNETVLYSFTGGNDGGYPYAVVMDYGGNLYGTTGAGGAYGWGVVFKLDFEGNETVLYTFTGGADGGFPYGGVIQDFFGNLYGTTTYGGASGAGVVFELNAAGQETPLYSFTGGADGSDPYGGVTMDPAGNLDGTTAFGGTVGGGVVFKLNLTGNETVYSFPALDGDTPTAGLIMDSAGNLYGTTYGGGAANSGVVFKLDPSGNETLLHTFTGYPKDGGHPEASLIMDSVGNLYGTTAYGGPVRGGTVFKLTSARHEKVLYAFQCEADGCNPEASLIRDSAGNLYGTAAGGGASGAGVVFKLDKKRNESVLYSFTGGADGGTPAANLLMDSAGNLYGTTEYGGASGAGVVFELSPTGGGGYSESVLYTFTGGSDGGYPLAGVIPDSAGNLYGTTYAGGLFGGGIYGPGVVFELSPPSGGGVPWTETLLYSFDYGSDGANPAGGVIMDSTGNLYGTAQFGGLSEDGPGVVFELSPPSDGSAPWTEIVCHTFTDGADGGYSSAGVIMDSTGNLYGTAGNFFGYASGLGGYFGTGGQFGEGVVFDVTSSSCSPGGSSPASTQPAHRPFGRPGFGRNHPIHGSQ